MPALVVWERLIFAGDDLRLFSIITFLLRMVQISMLIYIVVHVMRFNHNPEVFLATGCVSKEENYWIWNNASIAGCFFTLAYGIIGAFVEATIFTVSGRGSPTETDARELLVPLCKCNMLPMFMLRVAGFVFAVASITYTEQYCSCASSKMPSGGLLLENSQVYVTIDEACPISSRQWYTCARLLIFTMAFDALVPAIMLAVILRKRIYMLYRRIRPMRERSTEEVQRSWQMACKRCCECSSLMTCYMWGGQNLTAGSYVDVAIALTDFLGDEGSLDIVPSDIAAALICLVNIQKQKQIDCKNEMLNAGGIFAKDKGLAKRLWGQFFDSIPTTNPTDKRQESLRGVSLSLKSSLSINMDSFSSIKDIESGGVGADNQDDSLSCSNEEKEEIGERRDVCTCQSQSTSSLREPTDAELEHLRQMILTNNQSMERINFRLINRDSTMAFEPTVSRLLSPQNSFDCLVLGEGSRYCAVALAAYSWMLYLWTNKCTGCCELTADSLCGVCTCHPRCGCCHSNDNIIGSDLCGWKQASVLRSLGIQETDLLFANFQNSVGVNPYLILRDEGWKTIVLTIRGTLSFEDMISDVTITPDSLEEIGEQFGFDGRGEYCHSGMLAGATHIYEDLKRHKILDQAMDAHPDFGLRIVGHSLGAGVAAMLGLMLRQQYPKLYCLCFSPPGCVFSERTARESREYVCSVGTNTSMP
mmetsp:Transcript_29247/g.70557  ORF Transcript_29247/g.70557 Transcript_29247/m.70557 type:complete len:702 (-) Transcript_29247:703-2808(-)